MEESRIVKTKKNAITAISQNVLNIILSFLSRIIFVKVLSVEYLGINGLFSNILSVLSLADLGMQTAMMYSLYKPIADNDTKKMGSLVYFFKKIYLAIAAIIFAIGIIIIPFLKYIINLDTEIPNIVAYYILALMNIVISYLFIYRTTLVSADQKSYILNKYIMIFRIVTFIAQIVVLLLFRNYFIYLSVAVIISFISNMYQNKVAMDMYPFLKEKAYPLEKKDKDRIVRDIKALFIYKISGTIQSNTDNILISIFVGTVFVGYYSNYTMVITALISVISLIFASVKASVGNIIASEDADNAQKEFIYWVLELLNFWMVAFGSICCICLFPDFITLFFGKKYTLSIAITVAIVLNFYTNNIRQTMWTFRETTGLFHETRFITTVTAILNIIFSLVAGYYFGMFGILSATILARMLYAWWKEPLILFGKYFKTSAKKYYLIYIYRMLICIITGVISYSTCGIVNTQNVYINFIWKIIVCCVIPNIVFLLCFGKSSEFKYIFNKLIRPIMCKLKI